MENVTGDGRVMHLFRTKDEAGLWCCEFCSQKRDRFGREVSDSDTSVAV